MSNIISWITAIIMSIAIIVFVIDITLTFNEFDKKYGRK